MALSSSEIKIRTGMKGKAVLIIHVYQDYLWAMGDKSDPPEMKEISDDDDDSDDEDDEKEVKNEDDTNKNDTDHQNRLEKTTTESTTDQQQIKEIEFSKNYTTSGKFFFSLFLLL